MNKGQKAALQTILHSTIEANRAFHNNNEIGVITYLQDILDAIRVINYEESRKEEKN